jgi:hypothetical protein
MNTRNYYNAKQVYSLHISSRSLYLLLLSASCVESHPNPNRPYASVATFTGTTDASLTDAVRARGGDWDVLWREVELECSVSDLHNMLCINSGDGLSHATLCSKPEDKKTQEP